MPIQLKEDVEELMRDRMLFSAIEKLNLPRDRVILKSVCDWNTDAFGKPGSNKRAALQKRWKSIRNTSIRSYVLFLKQLRINPSDATKLEHDESRVPSPDSTTALGHALGNLSIQEGSTTSNGKVSPQTSIPSAPFNSSLNNKASRIATNEFSSLSSPQNMQVPTNVPPTVGNFNASTFSPPRKDAATMGLGSPTPSMGSCSFSSEWTESTIRGSKANPITIIADLDHPESSCPFFISRPGKKDDPSGNNEHLAFVIKKEFVAPDAPHYKMWHKVAQDGTNSLFVQVPSMSETFHQVEALHCNDRDSDHAKIAHQASKRIRADPSRLFRYYLIKINEYKLDNEVFSPGNHGVVQLVPKPANFAKNNFQVRSAMLEWTIAVDGTGLEKLKDTAESPFQAFQAQWQAADNASY